MQVFYKKLYIIHFYFNNLFETHPAIHSQFAVKIQPSSFCTATQTPYNFDFLPCL